MNRRIELLRERKAERDEGIEKPIRNLKRLK